MMSGHRLGVFGHCDSLLRVRTVSKRHGRSPMFDSILNLVSSLILSLIFGIMKDGGLNRNMLSIIIHQASSHAEPLSIWR